MIEVSERGIYLGAWGPAQEKDVFLIPDWLRDENGRQIRVLFQEAGAVLAARNEGRSYGKGLDTDISAAMKSGEYKEGDLFLPPLELLSGSNAGGEKARANSVCALSQTEAFEKIVKLDKKDPKFQRFALSGTALEEAICEVLLPSGFIFARPQNEGNPTAILAVRAFSR